MKPKVANSNNLWLRAKSAPSQALLKPLFLPKMMPPEKKRKS
jgi:hypothetical protein